MASEFDKPFLDNLEKKNWDSILILCLVSTCICLGGVIAYMFFEIRSVRNNADKRVAEAESTKVAYYEPIVKTLRYKLDSTTLKKIIDQDRLIAQFQGLDSAVGKKKEEADEGIKTLKRKTRRNGNAVQELIK